METTNHRTRKALAALVLAFVAAALGLSACDIHIDVDGFARVAADELATDTRADAQERALRTDRPIADVRVIGPALHRVVDLDPGDSGRFQPHWSGLVDSNGDHLDDDGRVGITVDRANVCIVIGADDATHTERGRC